MKILLLQLKRIGDLILTTPAIAALRDKFPGARITLVVARECADLLPAIASVDRTLVTRRKLRDVTMFFAVAREKFDYCIDFTRNDRSALLAFLSGAQKRVVSHRIKIQSKSRARVYNEFARHQMREMHTLDYHLALLEPLGHVYGVSNKVLAMALSDLLLASDAKRLTWIEAGAVMIAVDTLVHNFLHRTGILHDMRADHPYGPRCYAPGGCATIIERLAASIDARRFNPGFPANFPRFVQHAIWRFCAEAGLNRCNGRRIDDRAPCKQTDCPVFENCACVALKPA